MSDETTPKTETKTATDSSPLSGMFAQAKLQLSMLEERAQKGWTTFETQARDSVKEVPSQLSKLWMQLMAKLRADLGFALQADVVALTEEVRRLRIKLEEMGQRSEKPAAKGKGRDRESAE